MELYNYRAVVDRVVDGDTVDVNIDLGFDSWLMNQRVRLNGVDTPECRTRDLAEKAAGLLAKSVVEELLPPGTEVIVQTELRDKDKYGRILGTFFVPIDDIMLNINEHLIDNNYGVAYFGQNKELVEQAHLDNRAILESRGEL